MLWAPHNQRILLALAAVLLVAPSVTAHGGEEGVPLEPDVLWFEQVTLGLQWLNFTTYPPVGDGYAQPPDAYLERGTWTWSTGIPASWDVQAGTTVWLVAYVSGLGEADLVMVPTGDPRHPFGVPFEAVLRGPTGTSPLAYGEVVVPVDPLAPPDEVVQVTIPLEAERNATYGDGDALHIDLHAYGRGRKYSPLRLHVQDEEAATHVIVPGFPVAAFRAWEDAVALRACPYGVAVGRCADPPHAPADAGSAGDTTGADAPEGKDSASRAAWLVSVGAVCALGASAWTRRRHG